MRSLLKSLLKHPWLRLSPLLLFVLLLRLWDLDARSIWFDESLEFWASRPSLPELTRSSSLYLQPPLFSYLLHIWTKLGTSVIWMRFLSVLLSLGAAAGLMLWAYRHYSLIGAVIAGLIYTILPAEIRYAQEISEYSLMLFATTWSLVFLDSAVKDSSWRNWILWGIFSLVAAYSHYGASIVLISTGIIVALRNIRRKEWTILRRQMTIASTVALAVAPLVVFLLPIQLARVSRFDPQTFAFQPTQLLNWFTALDGAFQFLTTGWPYSKLPPLVPRGLLILFGLLILLVIVRRRMSDLHPVFLWSLLTYSVYFILVELGVYAIGIYGFRYSLILVPLLVMLLTAVSARLWRSDLRPLVYFSLGVLLFLCALSLPNRTLSETYRGKDSKWPETEDVREVHAFWLRERSDDDLTHVYYGASPAFRYYQYTAGEDSLPLQANWLQICWDGLDGSTCSRNDVHYGRWMRSLSPLAKRKMLLNAFSSPPSRFWIIFSHTPPQEVEGVIAQMITTFSVETSFQAVGASAYLLVRR